MMSEALVRGPSRLASVDVLNGREQRILLRRMDRAVQRRQEPLMVVLGQLDRTVCVDDGGGVSDGSVE